MINQWTGIDEIPCGHSGGAPANITDSPCIRSGAQVLEQFDFEKVGFLAGIQLIDRSAFR